MSEKISAKGWSGDGKTFMPVEANNVTPKLDRGVYIIQQTPQGELYLVKQDDSFKFKHKIYGIRQDVIDHITKSYDDAPKGLGVLLSGIKGTGKSVMAKILANSTGNPIIVCDRYYGGLTTFLDNINQDIVCLFDEFEKNFQTDKGADIPLLSLMDGTSTSPHKRMYVMTVNETRVNANLLDRPGRARFHIKFGNLTKEQVLEVVNDKLANKELLDSTVDYINVLKNITIDIITTVCTEVNLQNRPIQEFKDILNIEERIVKYTLKVVDAEGNIYCTLNTSETEILSRNRMTNIGFNPYIDIKNMHDEDESYVSVRIEKEVQDIIKDPKRKITDLYPVKINFFDYNDKKESGRVKIKEYYPLRRNKNQPVGDHEQLKELFVTAIEEADYTRTIIKI